MRPPRLQDFRRVARPFRRFLQNIGLVERPYFGLERLDQRLLDYVQFRNGVFVEAGANDGLSQSNTAYLERFLGWTGLLVEPVPHLAARCRFNRPKSIVAEAALVAADDIRTEVSITYCNLMTIVEGARGSAERDAEHIAAGVRFLGPGECVQTLVAPTVTLGALFQRFRLDRVDFLSLDVEGYEAQALRGLDLDVLAPTWILVEANDPPAVEAALSGRYEHIADLSHHDRLYRHVR